MRETARRSGAKSSEVADVARRLRRHVSAVSRIETGHSAIPADDLPVVLRAYRLTPEQFAERAMEAAGKERAA
jgi:hypothetical protein